MADSSSPGARKRTAADSAPAASSAAKARPSKGASAKAATTKPRTSSARRTRSGVKKGATGNARALAIPEELRSSRSSVRVLAHALASRCERYRVLAAAGVDHGAAARAWYQAPSEELSAAAMLTGLQAERHLLANDAEVLLALARRTGRLEEADTGVFDTTSLGEKDLERRAEASLATIASYLEGGPCEVSLLIHPVFGVQVFGERRYFEADFCFLPGGDPPRLRLGEQKTFYDFDGHTGQAEIAALRDQGAAYYACVITTLRAAGHERAADRVEPLLDAALRGPRLYLDWDVTARTEEFLRAFEDPKRFGAGLEALLEHHRLGGVALGPELFEALAPCAGAHCASCAFRIPCRLDDLAHGRLELLSPPSSRVLAPARTLERAFELAAGSEPHGGEELLADQLARARSALASCGALPGG